MIKHLLLLILLWPASFAVGDTGAGAAKTLAELKSKALQGDVTIQYSLGEAYLNGFEGLNIEKDPTEAMKWYTKAAESGWCEAMNTLARAYDQGKEVPKDTELSLKWTRQAADLGSQVAQGQLASHYKKGYGSLASDKQKAVIWSYIAGASGPTNEGGTILPGISQQDLTQQINTSADAGTPEAEFARGLMLEKGDGVEENPSSALAWYQKAADQDFPLAEYRVAWMLYNGQGGAKDLHLAGTWFTKAAQHGNTAAAFYLKLINSK